MPLERVRQRMRRDFHVRVAKSTVYEWVHAEAEADLGEAEYTQWVVARFSGVVGLDEVHLHDENSKKQYLVVAVDSINDRMILFDLVDSRDGDAIKGFLERLKALGIDPLVVVTDMWKAYHSALLDVFREAAHQLCIFHVIQAVMKHTNQALLAYRRALPQETETQKAVKKALWDCRYLLLKANHKLNGPAAPAAGRDPGCAPGDGVAQSLRLQRSDSDPLPRKPGQGRRTGPTGYDRRAVRGRP